MNNPNLIEHFDPMILENMSLELAKHLEIIHGLIEGKSYRAIGTPLGVGASTIKYFKDLHFPNAPSLKPDGKHTRKQREHLFKVRADRTNRDNWIKSLLPTHTYREIANEVGCSLGTVSNVNKQLEG